MTSPTDIPDLLGPLGRRVRERRLANGMTHAQLAESSGVSTRFLSDLEAGRGNISVVRLDRVSRALGIPIDELLRDEERADEHAPAPDAARRRLVHAVSDLDDDEVHELLALLRERRRATVDTDKVALIGLRGAGKTTIGTRVARRLRVPFVELDRRIEQAAGMTLDNLFSIHGEPYYRRLEHEVLSDVVSQQGPAVLATGGGIVTHPESYALLTRSCFTVWLRATPDDHWNRVVAQGDQRPMRGKPRAMAELRAILSAREPLYARAHRRIDTSRLDLKETVDAVARAITSE